MVFMTKMPESAEVTKKVMIKTTHMTVKADNIPPFNHLPKCYKKLVGVGCPNDRTIGTAGQPHINGRGPKNGHPRKTYHRRRKNAAQNKFAHCAAARYPRQEQTHKRREGNPPRPIEGGLACLPPKLTPLFPGRVGRTQACLIQLGSGTVEARFKTLIAAPGIGCAANQFLS